MSKVPLSRTGDIVWSRTPKTNSELFTLTYGVLVAQLLRDFEKVEEVNKELRRMGRNIGVRLIDEYLSKVSLASPTTPPCSTFHQTGDSIAKIGFKMFLGISCDISYPSPTTFVLTVHSNPLSTFVEIPPSREGLSYCEIMNGVIEGSLGAVSLRVESRFRKQIEKGDDVTTIEVEMMERIKDGVGEGYKDE
ncbi:hypothetical protein TrRE_jg6913 [Triparma retinervis]|uniref:Trafficking protein particle complex subunit n=1 Tax=Triparma retinervis TaxID=2557542 RepID=A0A9W7DTQ1_9STRA|nr:hypothetical protein TrRE_jg6913 [Triparma retinervis]